MSVFLKKIGQQFYHLAEERVLRPNNMGPKIVLSLFLAFSPDIMYQTSDSKKSYLLQQISFKTQC